MTTAPTTPDPAADTLATRVCPNCCEKFERPTKGPGGHKRFCSASCRTLWANREKADGAALITIALIWRENRGSGEMGKAAFAEVQSILDTISARRRAAGLLPLTPKSPIAPFVEDVLSERYIDRARSR